MIYIHLLAKILSINDHLADMPKYSSKTNLVWEAFLACLIIATIGFGIFSAVENLIYQILAISITLILIGLIMYYARIKAFSILFEDKHVVVKYRFINKVKHINYSDIMELKYINASKSPTTNEIKFKEAEQNLSLKFLSIEYESYIEFVKWIKSKNDKIQLTVFPSDNYMNHRLQEIYGFKYRK
ncbi:hypothetical protein GGR42_002510 [Saonia flava]|uniref:Uncharacterized protein n=1 Tax=Saonia flava TaxID=523696 RepID=A0A846R5G1_9FLAO|nr:hypothetical protein [Saonia flava]NJB72019.1 hypothetical protein [Saonia flava]